MVATQGGEIRIQGDKTTDAAATEKMHKLAVDDD